MPPPPWFSSLTLLLDAAPRSAAMNMAIDQALLETTGQPVLRVYHWDQPSISIGFSQNWEPFKDTLPAWPVVRRWTGGGVVLHDCDTTYSLIVPADDPWSRTRPLDSYRLIHESLATHLGHGRLAGEAERKEDPQCFQAPALHDILMDDGKVAGAGQRRTRLGLLHQGSIRLRLGEAFWQSWAASIAGTIHALAAPPGLVLERAVALVDTRYHSVVRD